MEKLFEMMLACLAILMMPVAQRDEKALQKNIADMREAMKNFKGDQATAEYKQMAENLKALENTVKTQGDKLNTLGKGRMDGHRILLGADEVRSLRRARTCFADAEEARMFGACVARSVFGGSHAYEQRVSSEARGLAEEVMKAYGSKAMDPNAAGAGGDFVPNIFIATLIAHLETIGNIFPLCQRVPLSTTGATTYPKRAGGLTAHPTAVSAEIEKSYLTSGNVTLRPVKWGVLTAVPNEFWANPQLLVNLGQLIGLEITRAMAYAFDNAIINGDGTDTYGGITGIYNNLSLTASSAAATHTTMATITGTDVSNVIAAMTKQYVLQDSPYWIFNVSTKGKVRALKSTTGQPLYLQGANGEPNSIDGYPFEISSFMKPAASVAAGDIYGAFGSLRMAILFGMLQDLRIDESRDAMFSSDQTAIRGIASVDAKWIDNDAIIPAKTAAQ